jgi:SET family sugar efflux transporter-like MFS transporter
MQRFLTIARTILARRDFMALLGCNVLLGLAYSFVGPFMSMFGTQEVKMSNFTFGVFMTFTSISSIVLSTLLAHWSDTRISRRSMLVLGAACGTAGYAAYAMVRDVVALTLIGSLVLGIASITFSQLFAHAREMLSRSDIPAGDTPLYMNVFRLFFALAWTVGPATAAWCLSLYSYRGTFLVAALVFFLFLLAVLRYVPYAPPFARSQSTPPMPLRQALVRPVVLAHFIAFSLVFTAATICMSNLPLLVLNTLAGTERQVGIVYSVAPVFELPFMFIAGMLATKGDQARLIRLAVILSVVYYAGLSVVGSPWHIYPLQVISAAIVAVTSGIAITFFQNFLPDQVGTATNLYSTSMRLGGIAGYLSYAGLADRIGHRWVFVFCTAICVLALAILSAYRRPLHDTIPARPA